ncbi:MAG: prepilin-type N-terminal cleavage/methylation domain-containing protein [Gammaproteobacteria bacterium]|nr:prepilin-type N-terminal cleavage/methylation domain-containing protein [Gammaproteobacteria bacterium]
MSSDIHAQRQTGFTLLEVIVSLAIAALLLTALTNIVTGTLDIRDDTRARNEVTRELRFAMDRMVTAVRGSDRLLLPLAENPNTNWRESVREQSVPPKPPEGASKLATAVLAITLDPMVDRDADGWADANNDKDFLDRNNNGSRDADEPERVDEDAGADLNNDIAAGILGIDDDGDGLVDESNKEDDDEDEDQTGNKDEDRFNGIDDDKDGAIDEDPGFDMNEDGQAGVSGVDDDGDTAIDESSKEDDDEDEDNSGAKDEDWFDSVVFFLSGTTLMERLPNLNPADGTDYAEYPIAENVTHFRVERVPDAGRRAVLVDIALELSLPGGEPASVNTRVRVGGAQ